MTRLWVRLALAFTAVSLIAVGVIALIANVQAGQAFQQYVAQSSAEEKDALAETLAAYFRQVRDWRAMPGAGRLAGPRAGGALGEGEGVGTVGEPDRTSLLVQLRLLMRHPRWALADATGHIVVDAAEGATERRLSADELGQGQPIVVDDRTVGYLLPPSIMRADPHAETFRANLGRTLALAALAAAGAGVMLGLFVSRAVAAPLAHLAQAARALATRQWDRRVSTEHSIAEINDLARAFNEMAEALESAERMRRDMVADIAHELRTPLTVMQGNLRALLDEVYPLDRAEIATLYDETRLIGRLVDDLRELSLADAGSLSLRPMHVDAEAVLRTAVTNFVAAAEAQGITVRLALPDDLPAVQADADRVAQILRNLLSNALRHTPEGGTITVSATPEVDQVKIGQRSSQVIRITVADTGEGIAPEALPHVFDRLYRADRSRSRATGGSGLGLTIARAWTEAMGGQIGAASHPGQGSRFWFTLPQAAS